SHLAGPFILTPQTYIVGSEVCEKIGAHAVDVITTQFPASAGLVKALPCKQAVDGFGVNIPNTFVLEVSVTNSDNEVYVFKRTSWSYPPFSYYPTFDACNAELPTSLATFQQLHS